MYCYGPSRRERPDPALPTWNDSHKVPQTQAASIAAAFPGSARLRVFVLSP